MATNVSHTSEEAALNALETSMTTPAGPLTSFSELMGDTSRAAQDIWLSDTGMSLSRIIAAIPPPYATEVYEGRALYVVGVPHSWKRSQFVRLFFDYAKIEKAPTVIDTTSEDTFRWLIVRSKEEAERIMDTFADFELNGVALKVCRALLPGRHLLLGNRITLDHLCSLPKNQEEASTVHGHPSPPQIRLQAPEQPEVSQQPQAPEELETTEQPQLSPAAGGGCSPPLPPLAPFPEDEPEPVVPKVVKPPSPIFITQAASWANIASAATPDSRTIDLHPENRITSSGPRLHPIGRIPSVSSSRVTVQQEPMVEQIRVVFILNIPETLNLVDVSNAIKEGPICSIRFGVDSDDEKRYAGIIFQHARDAESFFQVLVKERIENAPRRFRFIANVVRGEAFPADDTIRAMSQPPYATRRLTVVKKGFFFVYGERHLRNLCEKVVGKDNVELVFLYNGGNATVVFAEVAAAIKVKDHLEHLKDTAGREGSSLVYAGLNITFSKDPCELDGGLNLQSAM
ncbi:hypothetical protein B7494_g4181 [Chlorociboria aeruginascens]|nr:hypothetical protein B7494_g4181 [Chlorociboria aeruginascens]